MKHFLPLLMLTGLLFGQSYRKIKGTPGELPNYVMKVNAEVLGFMLGETEEEMLKRFPKEMIQRVFIGSCPFDVYYECDCKCKTYYIDGNIAKGKNYSSFEVVVVVSDSSSYRSLEVFPNLVYIIRAYSYISDFGEEFCIDRFNAYDKSLSPDFILEAKNDFNPDDVYYYYNNRTYRSWGRERGGEWIYYHTLVNGKPVNWKIHINVSRSKRGDFKFSYSEFAIVYFNMYLEDYYREKKYLLY